MERLIEWLPANVPSDEQSCLVHGDFRLDNMIFDARASRACAPCSTGSCRRSAIRWPISPTTACRTTAHFAPRCRWARSPVKPAAFRPRQQHVAAYCRRTGRESIPNSFRFYLAFSFFRSASIVQGVYHRGLQGNASSAQEALSMRARTLAAAETGWRIVDEGA